MDAEDRAEIEALRRAPAGAAADKATHDALLGVDLKERARRPPSAPPSTLPPPPPAHLPCTALRQSIAGR